MGKKKMAAQVARKVFDTAHSVMNHVTYRDDVSDDALCEICDRLEPVHEQADLLHIVLTGEPIAEFENLSAEPDAIVPISEEGREAFERLLDAIGGENCQCDACQARRAAETPPEKKH